VCGEIEVKEKDLYQNVHEAVLNVWPTAVIYKTNDRATAGIPDSIITVPRIVGTGSATTFLEFKHLDPKEDMLKALTPVQQVELFKLAKVGGRAWAVGFRKSPLGLKRQYTEIYNPLFFRREGVVPHYINTPGDVAYLMNVLRHDGIAQLPGFDYDAVAALCQVTA
jgi:hypothetical protein